MEFISPAGAKNIGSQVDVKWSQPTIFINSTLSIVFFFLIYCFACLIKLENDKLKYLLKYMRELVNILLAYRADLELSRSSANIKFKKI